MKNSVLATMINEISRHRCEGDVYNRVTTSECVINSTSGSYVLPFASGDAVAIRLTLNDRTAVSSLNRFDASELNIRMERMKRVLSRMAPHPPLAYPGPRTVETGGGSSPDRQSFRRTADALSAAVLAAVSSHCRAVRDAACTVRQTTTIRSLLNTRGFDGRDERSSVSAHLRVVLDIHNHPVIWENTVTTDSLELSPEQIVGPLTAVWSDPGAVPGKLTGQRPAILSGPAVRSLLVALISLLDGRTFMSDVPSRRPEQDGRWISPLITVTAGDTVSAAAETPVWDDDGIATGMLPLITRGVIDGPIDDLMSAARNGRRPGRCFRGDDLLPRPGWRRIRMSPGVTPLKDMLDIPGNGVVIFDLETPNPDPVTGEFSVGYTGRLVSQGALGAWIVNGALTGSIQNLMRRVDAVGNALSPSTDIVICPSLRFSTASLI
ncbi:hypothetical protein JXA80_06950 [bacterium]|nr:hypothetical protein [candidate division CSSED10-310 bacterium]